MISCKELAFKAGLLFLLPIIMLPPPVWGDQHNNSTDISDNNHGDYVNNNISSHLSRVSIRFDPPSPILVTGEEDSLCLLLSIDSVNQEGDDNYIWDRRTRKSLVAWLSAPPESGITFINKNVPHRSGHQVQIIFQIPEGNRFAPICEYIHYSVEKRTQTGTYSILADISVDLRNGDLQRIHEVGVVNLPVEIDTHLRTKITMLLVIAVVVFLFIVEWIRIDVVAILVMLSLPELGLLNVNDTFRGLSSNAVIAIIGVMIISFGLNRAGLVNRVVNPLMKYVASSASRLVVVFSALIAVISSVMQNTGAAVLFLPAIRLITANKLKIHLSRVLMPIGMAAILGGTMTMIGTSPLILLNDILPPWMEKFGFLELTPIGIALVITGIIYLSTVGMKWLSMLPMNQVVNEKCHNELFESINCSYPLIEGPFEVVVPEKFIHTHYPQDIANIRRKYMVNIAAIKTEENILLTAPPPYLNLNPGMSLWIYSEKKAIESFAEDYNLTILEEPESFKEDLSDPSFAGIAEMVISPRSTFIGKTIRDIRFRETFHITALALHQNGEVYYRELADRSLNPGDAILIHGTWDLIHTLKKRHENFIIISSPDIEVHRPEKAKPALISFLITLVAMIVSSFYLQRFEYNPLPLSLCLMSGAILMILTRVVSISDAYRAVDWRTVFLLGGLIPLGAAVDHTGTANWIAQGIVYSLDGLLSPLVLLIVLAVLSCLFTMIISNVGACALLVPLGISIATHIGIDPRVAALVVGIGVSNSFLLPTHQVNALYMVPGEYRTRDYMKIGGGLSIVYITVLVSVTYFLYL